MSLDLFWLRDESLEDSANLPDPNILAQEIADDLRSALGQIEDILGAWSAVLPLRRHSDASVHPGDKGSRPCGRDNPSPTSEGDDVNIRPNRVKQKPSQPCTSKAEMWARPAPITPMGGRGPAGVVALTAGGCPAGTGSPAG